jgi:DNA mismatch repair protein MutL
LLEKVGFDLENFGGNSWAVRAVPAVFAQMNANQTIRDFLDQAEDGKLRTTIDESTEAVAALCACKKKSVKARDPLDFRQMQSLLEQLALCENPFNCPHGRPTFFTQTMTNLERQFKRIV